MSVRSFFDTNVLIYADDKGAPAKQRRSLELIEEHRRARTGVVSLQVLQEYFVTATRKLQLDARIARRKVELLDKSYPSQRGRDWWDEETFLALARLRGMECRARYAEAFTCAKLVIS